MSILFQGNCSTSVVKQAKYRIKSDSVGYHIEIQIDTLDGLRFYPSTNKHPDLVSMINQIKEKYSLAPGGQFYINEWRQVIVPVNTTPVTYYYAGEYEKDITFLFENIEYSGRPINNDGSLLSPNDDWQGLPRPGIQYTLKVNGKDIEYKVEIRPKVEKINKLSDFVGKDRAAFTAQKIASIKGKSGGAFYINEFRAIFAPVQEYSYSYKFIGILSNEDPWFPKWDPNGVTSQNNSPGTTPKTTTKISNVVNIPIKENVIKIKKDEIGHTYESLLGSYLKGAREIMIQDSYLELKYQFQNLIRFMELCVKLGSLKKIILTTKKVFEKESFNRLQKSMLSHGINLTWSILEDIHDRFIETDTGWHIHLGFGLDIYQKPNDYDSIGASDFSLRPCKETIISINRKTEPLAS